MTRKPTRSSKTRDMNEALDAIQRLAGKLPDSIAGSRIQGTADIAALLDEGLLDQLQAAINTAREIAEDLDAR